MGGGSCLSEGDATVVGGNFFIGIYKIPLFSQRLEALFQQVIILEYTAGQDNRGTASLLI
ncbi:MAG TPA: hypothetical protein DCY75_03015 [Clostridiales bacterium]|nr:hypothetical protein [Clostridiales bacterium]